MQKMIVLCVGCVPMTLWAPYYGPPASGINDSLYAQMTQQSISATKSLERTIAARPSVALHTYNHHDQSTRLSFGGDNNAPIVIRKSSPYSPPVRTPGKQQSQSWWQRCTQWNMHRDLTYKALLLGYAYLNFRLFRASAYVQERDRWFLWRQELPLAQLISIPAADLAAALVADIRTRYGAYKQDGNPFGLFMKALDEEEAVLHKYQTLSNILLKVDDLEHRCVQVCCGVLPKVYGFSLASVMTGLAARIRVKTFFYLDDDLLFTIPDRLARLAYLKTIFSDWLASHKLLIAKQHLNRGVTGLRRNQLALRSI